jgi:pimeloyl-ACP methyl ester carboxylesterase
VALWLVIGRPEQSRPSACTSTTATRIEEGVSDLARRSVFRRSVLSPTSVSRSTALSLTERISAVTHIISSLEYLAKERDRTWGGLNNWKVIRTTMRSRSPVFGRLQDFVGDRRVTRALHMARVGAGIVLLGPARGRSRVAANALLGGASLALHRRHVYGSDGTDQASFLVQTATAVARAGERRPQVVDAALWFVSLQATAAYALSGWAKLASPTWRSGDALQGVMRTRAYGDPNAWRMLQRYPRGARALAAGLLALECLFPAVYLASGRFARPILMSAGAFHLANARVMGLGRFVWAFGSMYPALLYTTGPREQPGAERRDDLVPAFAAAAATGAVGAAFVAAASRRALVMRGRDHEKTLTTSSGNRLSYRMTGPQDGHSPIIVVAHGLLSTAEHWEWITRGLSARFTTVTYHRAGYGRSRYGGGRSYGLDVAVQDLTDLIDRLAGERPVVVLGHSLGGYLAIRAADLLPARVIGVGVIDSSHPAELRRSPQQAGGARHMAGRLALMSTSARLGMGSLLSRPRWVDELPESVRRLALAQYRDAGIWEASVREWRAVQSEFGAFDGRLPHINVPMLVLTSAITVQFDPVHGELQAELAKSASRADHHVLEDADHNSILMHRSHAARATELISAFVDSLELAPGGESHGSQAI